MAPRNHSRRLPDFSFRKPLEKSVLGDKFPKAGFVFRGEARRETGPDYEHWERDVEGNVGIIRKFVQEELTHPERMDEAKLSSYLKKFAKRHPDQLFLLHFNGRSKVFDFHKDKFFVGHYLQYEGVRSASRIKLKQNVIEVPSAEPFFVQRPFGGRETLETDSIVVMVERDRAGTFHWEHHEFAYLTAVDKEKNTITVKRGVHDTKPTRFKAGQCYIAQIQQYSGSNAIKLFPGLP